MFRTLCVVVASGIVLVASAASAIAATVQPTSIVGFATSVTTMTYEQPVTFTGELTVGSAKTPVAGEPVQIEFQGPGQALVTVATATTGTNGQFSATTTLPSGGYVMAVFAGDATNGLGASSSGPPGGIYMTATTLPSRLLLDAVPASVPAGTSVTFSGTLQVEVNGAWQPFAGAPLTLTMEPYTSTQPNATYSTTTGADGRFSLTEAVTETSGWSIDTTRYGTYFTGWFNDYAEASYGWINGVSKTLIVGFSIVPPKVEAHVALAGGLHANGTVERWNGSSWVGLAYGWVQFYYRPSSRTTWRKDYSTQADANGNFHGLIGVYLGTKYWQARVVPAADTLTSTTTNTVTGTVTDQTHFFTASATRTKSGSNISGEVIDYPPSGGASFSKLNGLAIRLYYRKGGTTTWHLAATSTTYLAGFFNFTSTLSYGYYFEVVLPAQFPYLGCTSSRL